MNFLTKILLLLLRVIFLPLKLIINVIYGKYQPHQVIPYAWYTPMEYDKLIKSSKDVELGNTDFIDDYNEWQEYAESRIKYFTDRGFVIIKFNMNIEDLQSWLDSENLLNTSKNRVKYLDRLFRQEKQNGLRIVNCRLKYQ